MTAPQDSRSTPLDTALEREHVLTAISQQVRSRVDVDAALDDTVELVGRALGALRAFIRIDGDEPASIMVEWTSPGAPPVAALAERLAGTNLAARLGHTITLADIRQAPELDDPSLGGRETLLAAGVLAVLATPIVVRDAIVGVLTFHRSEAGVWSQGDIDLAEGVAREAAVAIHMARLLEETEHRLAQATALFEAARVVTGELRLELVLKRLVMALARLLHADAADCYLLDTRRDTLRCTAAFELDPVLVQWEFPADEGLAGEALRRGRSLLSRDYPALQAPGPHPAYRDFASYLVAPMLLAGEKQGVVGVATRDQDRVFTRGDADVLEAFAGLASVALRNAAAFEQSAQQARAQRAFYRIAAALAAPLSQDETLEAVVEAAKDAVGGVFAAALLPTRMSLRLVGSRTLPDALADALARAPAGALNDAARDGRVLTAQAIGSDDRFDAEWKNLVLRSGGKALLAIPLGEAVSGPAGLVVVFFATERAFGDDDVELARHLAAAAAGALVRSELFETERNSRALAQHLARISGLLAPELDPLLVLREVAREAPLLLGADACVVHELLDGELVVSAAEGEGAAAAAGSRAVLRGSPAREVLESQAPVVKDAAGPDERSADPLLAGGYDAYLSVPLTASEGGVQGVISVYSRSPRPWRPDEVDALLAVAGSASAALANAQLYQRVALEKERNEAILAAIADGIVATDAQSRVVLWNAEAERITGVPAAEALGRQPSDVLQRELASEGEAPSGDRVISITRGGHDVWLSLTEAVMSDHEGSVTGRVFAFRDISGERLVEQMKSDFVSTVSHELRTPLTSIYGFSATLLRGDLTFDDEERLTFLTYIASESERLTRVLDALLHVARLDSGDLELQLGSTSVGEVVAEVVAGAEAEARDGHRFVVELPDGPVAARADGSKLRQVLGALIDNAVKYSPGGGTVTIAARERTNAVELRVVDEGIGIAPAEQPRIFTKFYRGVSAPLDGERGPGLSLFIARGLVTAMGGRLSVSSVEGEGSSFVVELPAA